MGRRRNKEITVIQKSILKSAQKVVAEWEVEYAKRKKRGYGYLFPDREVEFAKALVELADTMPTQESLVGFIESEAVLEGNLFDELGIWMGLKCVLEMALHPIRSARASGLTMRRALVRRIRNGEIV